MELVLENLREGYQQVIREVWTQGARSSPRGQDTREVMNAHLTLLDPKDALPTGIDRRINVDFAAIEALQLVAASSNVLRVTTINPNLTQFLDEGLNDFYGAYGPRLTNWPHVVRRLEQDPHTRQAVALIWRPADQFESTRDLPCTVFLQYLYRQGQLHAHTFMRSNDVWWGLAYDMFQFTQLQLTIARQLGMRAGPYTHHATSLHLYERDFEGLERVVEAEPRGGPLEDYPNGFYAQAAAYDTMLRARELLWNPEPDPAPNSQEAWFSTRVWRRP